MALAVRRLPGIDVGVAPPPVVEALPRMDVAALVGFAATGPVHTPVAIESVAQFTAIFGSDAPLAWDGTRDERVYAYLGPAVRAFFANGGRRCWIIRVARAPIANAFGIPGVLAVAEDGTLEPAVAAARCEGSWSDGLRVATARQVRTIAIDLLGPASSPASAAVSFRTRFGLRPGDLIELGDDADVCAYATVDAVRATQDANGPYIVEATVCAAFERLIEFSSPSSPPGWSGSADVSGIDGPIAATLSAAPDANSPARLQFDAPVSARLEAGHWVRWSDAGTVVWLLVDDIQHAPAFVGSPPAMTSAVMNATVTGPAWRELGTALPFALGAARRAHLVLIDVQVEGAEAPIGRLSGVGLTPAHPDTWWQQVSDAELYRPREDTDERMPSQAARTEQARFPLASAPGPAPQAWIPLGVTTQFGSRLAPLPQSLTALERDGLATFDADLFLDPELADVAVHGIAELADAIRFVREPVRALRGLHGAWSVGAGGLFNEVSLLAIPDAIHLGWHPSPDEPIPAPVPQMPPAPPQWQTHRGVCAEPDADSRLTGPDFGAFLDCATRALAAPVLEGPSGAVHPGPYRLTWTNSEPGGSYELLECTESDLSDPRQIHDDSSTECVALNPREGVYYYQVFAHVGDERSAGSNIVAVRVRRDDWVQNRPTHALDDVLETQWLAVHRAALRMAAASGDLFVALTMPRHFRTEQAIRYARRLRAVQQPPDVADLHAFGFTEWRALSYGALYFPWLQSDVRAIDPGRELSAEWLPTAPAVVPPDGAALGVLAGRAASRGAWIAPANEPMRGVVAVTPTVSAADWQALLDAQINLIRADPRGFLAWSADTLALDEDLRPINVRRLLILLRRLALRRGISYVFEPNGPVLRRAVQRGFDLLLTDLFQRGAFAGATAADSFRVLTDDTINQAHDAEVGRFLVELRVAPSVPMRFIAVLLAQSGARLTVREEL